MPAYLYAGVAAANPGLQKLIMGLVFPVNILMVTICGAELYTGNTAVVSSQAALTLIEQFGH